MIDYIDRNNHILYSFKKELMKIAENEDLAYLVFDESNDFSSSSSSFTVKIKRKKDKIWTFCTYTYDDIENSKISILDICKNIIDRNL